MTSVLVTGGTGSFGQAFIRRLLRDDLADRVVVFSRDELKQHEMRAAGFADPRLRWFIGDVRDRDRLRRAMAGVSVVVHAAALKHVAACEANPLEAVKTNVGGAANVIDAALDAGVGRVIGLSTDKACSPANLYGASKLLMEKLLVDANVYSGRDGTRFSVVRYGNVANSRGSVLPIFAAQQAAGEPLTVTDPLASRFTLTLEQATGFVLDSLDRMIGGEVFVPRLPAVTTGTVAQAVAYPEPPRMKLIGIQAGEKRHELLISGDEAARALDCGTYFVLRPPPLVADHAWPGAEVPDGWAYSSESPPHLSVAAFRELVGLGIESEAA